MDRPAATPGVDISTPHHARVADYWLGGKDNFAADREVADAIAAQMPGIAEMARATYRFAQRAVRHQVVELGIRQFVNFGSGIPTGMATHKTAQEIEPCTRVVYIDPDPIVATHSRALLASHPKGRAEFVEGSIDQLSAVLDDPELTGVIDLSRPVSFNIGVTLMVHSDEAAAAVLDVLKGALVPGGCLVASHGTRDFQPEAAIRAAETGTAAGLPHGNRTHEQFSAFFAGLELVEPGVVGVVEWRPDAEETVRDPKSVSVYGGLARKR